MRNCVVLLSCLLLNVYSFAQTRQAGFQHYKLDINAKKVDFFDRVAAVEFVRLEETEASLLPTVESYFDLPEGYGILDYQGKSLVFFNRNGDFTGQLNRFGGGPEEYLNFGKPWFKGDHIEIYDWEGGRLQSYNLNGEHLSTRRVNTDARTVDIHPTDKGYLMTTIGHDFRDTKGGPEVLFVNEQLQVQQTAFHRDRPHPFPINLGGHFMKLDEDLIFKKKLTDSAFLIRDHKAIPFMKFDFGDEWAWNIPESAADVQSASEMISKSGLIYEMIVAIGPEIIDLRYFRDIREKHRGYIDRKTGKFYHYKLRRTMEEDFRLLPLKWEQEYLVHSLDSDELEDFIEKLGETPWQIRGEVDIDEVMESENPVLVYVKFK